MFSVSFFAIFTLSKLRFLVFLKCNLPTNCTDSDLIVNMAVVGGSHSGFSSFLAMKNLAIQWQTLWT